jgi:hypothetical protein
MKLKAKLLAGVGALVLAANTQASLIVDSIDLAMVKTDYNSRTDIPGWMWDELAFVTAGLQGFAAPWANPENRLCQQSLDAFDNISASETCGGPNRNVGSLFAITGSATSSVEVQLGLDWGRGGFTMLALPGSDPAIARYNSDIWWKRNWNNGDVIDLIIPETPEFLLVGLGFEGCCDGDMSGRWRSLGGPSTFADNGPGQWQTLAVNAAVPEPGVAYLLGLGLLGLVVSRRNGARGAGRHA